MPKNPIIGAQALGEAQWVKCDIRSFDMTVLGKFGVVMADPPWEIHQDLPYGTMADDEMRRLNIGALQDEGVIFLWVTGGGRDSAASRDRGHAWCTGEGLRMECCIQGMENVHGVYLSPSGSLVRGRGLSAASRERDSALLASHECCVPADAPA